MWSTTSSVLIRYKLLLLMLLFVDCGVSYSSKSHESDESGTFGDNSTDDEEIRYIIFGGEPSLIYEFPFMAVLGWVNETGHLNFHCGGTLISTKMVLTAAHCVYLNGFSIIMWSTTSSVLIRYKLLLLMLLFVDCGVSYLSKSHESDESGTFGDNSTDDEVLYIVGGEPIFFGEFPFMAALGWLGESGNLDFHCGGVLISSNMVLTAAHCVHLNGKIPDVVHIGGYSLTTDDSHSLNQQYSVVNVTVFPQYNPNQAYYDIALLELEYDTIISPVCLWTKPNLYVNNVTAIGYGLTAFAGDKSQELLKVDLTVFPENYCQPFFKRQRKFKLGLTHAHICAGDMNGQKDTCQGDSGGPLIVMHNDKPYAVGITSTGQACSGFPPAIYTKISSYIDWINKVLSDHDYPPVRNCS